RWFSLLVTGGTHNGDTVPAMQSVDNAALLAYWTLRFELIESSDYLFARASSIAAAQALFGACSPNYISTVAAWDAVQVPGTSLDCGALEVADVPDQDAF